MQIKISWHLQKPLDLDLHCLQMQDISRFGRTNVNIIILLFPENRLGHFMQFVSLGDNLHEMSKPVFWNGVYVIVFM